MTAQPVTQRRPSASSWCFPGSRRSGSASRIPRARSGRARRRILSSGVRYVIGSDVAIHLARSEAAVRGGFSTGPARRIRLIRGCPALDLTRRSRTRRILRIPELTLRDQSLIRLTPEPRSVCRPQLAAGCSFRARIADLSELAAGAVRLGCDAAGCGVTGAPSGEPWSCRCPAGSGTPSAPRQGQAT